MNGDTRQQCSCRSNEQGVILVLVLILLGAITALVIQAQVSARMALRAEERKITRGQLRAAATDAAWGALNLLAGDDDLRVDHTNEPWATPEEQQLPNGIETFVQIEDEHRGFDVNSLSAPLPETTKRMPLDIARDLLALSRQPDPQVQARVLKDWIDPDHEGLREAEYYRSLSPPAIIADTLMESPQELAAVLALAGSGGGVPPGFVVLPARNATPAYNASRSDAGRHSVAGGPDRGRRIMPVNLNTAGREVLLAVMGPQNAGQAEVLIGIRDAGPLTSLEALTRLGKAGTQNPWSQVVDVKSSYFSVTARAVKDGWPEEVYALVRRDPRGNIDILRWVCR